MEIAKLTTFARVRRYSSASAVIAILLSLIFNSWIGTSSLTWQVVMAAVALAIGIPHGALDHLVTLPKSNPAKMAAFIAGYVAIALLAVAAILHWNKWGFIGVVLMSAVHFGIGDSAFLSELKQLGDKTRTTASTWAYAAASGAIPVVIPLVNDRSASALKEVNPALLQWDGGYSDQIFILVIAISVVAAAILLMHRELRDLVDLAILLLLVICAPPLVAFATYFGCWHAMRHTARLSSLLPQSVAHYSAGKPAAAFRASIIPGLPALVGTFIFVIALGLTSSENLSDRFLWLTLVTIWALTVPHMIVTARLDRAALKKR
jgi:Brp/Blh family beta-carotene 15,15'-monooxygenase